MANDPNQLRTPDGYICPKCKAQLYGKYHPYCGECGRPLPSELRMQSVGLTIYSARYESRSRDPQEINQFLLAAGATDCWLEAYFPTFRTTRIRVERTGQQSCDHEIVCTGTSRIELPIDNGWRGTLGVRREGELIRMHDEVNDVSVVAGSISLHSVHVPVELL